jgi:hypothetical protein
MKLLSELRAVCDSILEEEGGDVSGDVGGGCEASTDAIPSGTLADLGEIPMYGVSKKKTKKKT